MEQIPIIDLCEDTEDEAEKIETSVKQVNVSGVSEEMIEGTLSIKNEKIGPPTVRPDVFSKSFNAVNVPEKVLQGTLSVQKEKIDPPEVRSHKVSK